MPFQRPNYFGSPNIGGLLNASLGQISQAQNAASNYVPQLPTQAAAAPVVSGWEFLKKLGNAGLLGFAGIPGAKRQLGADSQPDIEPQYQQYRAGGGGFSPSDWFHQVYAPGNELKPSSAG